MDPLFQCSGRGWSRLAVGEGCPDAWQPRDGGEDSGRQRCATAAARWARHAGFSDGQSSGISVPDTEVYNAITEVLAANNGDPTPFFTGRLDKDAAGAPNLAGPLSRQTLRTRQIIQRIQSLSFTPVPPANPSAPPSAYQAPPASPVDNEYFGGAPFLFGDDAAMRFSAKPRSPVAGESLNLTDDDYLRAGLRERLAVGAQDVVFDFQVQVRKASELAASIGTDIEDACVDWDPTAHPFKTMATITIPPQEFETEERRAHCENLFFTPWHGIAEHRPLGGINRLRRAVYRASSGFRRSPKGAAAATDVVDAPNT